MNTTIYDFSLSEYDDLEQAAEEAVHRIYGAGLMFYNGKVQPGGNNVLAGRAAQAFNQASLDHLKASPQPRVQLYGRVISLRQEFENTKDDPALLESIYQTVQDLKKTGWQPRREPVRLSGPR